MEVGLSSVLEESVWRPQPIEALDADLKGRQRRGGEGEAFVDPRLSEVEIHLERLNERTYDTLYDVGIIYSQLLNNYISDIYIILCVDL